MIRSLTRSLLLIPAFGLALGLVACEAGDSLADAESADPSTISPAQGVDFSGTWKLDPDLSDDFGRPRPPFDGERPGDAPADRPSPGDLPSEGERPGPGFEIFTVTHGEGTVTFTHGHRSRTLHTDGRAETIELRDGRTVRVKAYWQGEALIVERTLDRDALTETWRLGDEGARLLVTVRIENGPRGEPVQRTRVYDRA